MIDRNASSLRSFVTRFGAVALLGLPLAACDQGAGPVEDLDAQRIVEVAETGTCVTLYAGQHIEAGTVCVTVDNTVDTSAHCGAGATGVVDVVYSTTNGWGLEQTHLAVGDELADIPTNNKGNPKIGQFEHAIDGLGGITSQGYSVPLCDLGLDGADEVCEPVTAHIAAHAVVSKATDDGGTQTETAWGDGSDLTEQGSWAESFTMSLQCKKDHDEVPPPVAQCETAFAMANDGSATCFIGADFDGDGADDGFNRWGWSNGPIAPGTSTQWPVYAGAGQCNTDNGELVGHLSVSYDGATAQVDFERVGDIVLDEEHLYVGGEALARNVNGELTVSPGQFPVVVDLDSATQTSNTVGGLSGDIYVVYHAVACGAGGDDKINLLGGLDDDFDGDLGDWDVYNPGAAAVSIAAGSLEIEPNANTQWYGTDEAVHVNKLVPGNFAVTTRMTVTNLAGGSAAPGGPYRIGGLLLRDPSGGPNTVHVGIGAMTDTAASMVSKSTVGGVSSVGTQPWAAETVAEMRLCRVGADVQALIRVPGEAWTIVDWHQRPDLGEELAVGPMAYAGTADADLRATTEWVHFHSVSTLADCMHD